MSWRRGLAFVVWCGALAFAVLLVIAAWSIRSPALLSLRPWPPILLVVVAAAFLALAFAFTRRRARWARWSLFAPAVAAIALGLIREGHMAWLKSRVLASPQEELRAAARHLVVGFGAFEDLDALVTHAGVAGVFVGRRNARDRDEATLARDIARLQALRRTHGLPPLFVATDQEGGAVAALSPPLPRPPALSSLAHAGELVVDAAEQAARDLACVGVNVNFAPVVDIGRRLDDPAARLSPMTRRAISSDERTVAQTARDYCRAFREQGVQCTLKHFPGLGPARGDTHAQTVTLPEVRDEDLFPFREIARDEPPWIMLGHVEIAALDPGRPASASARAISVLRRDWGFDGVLVTDDVSMAAYARDVRGNVVATLSGGADLALASYDPDLAYVALDAIIRARRGDPAFAAAMQTSAARLARSAPAEPFCRRLASRR